MTIAPTTEQYFAERMERLGLTQCFLAEYVGLSQGAISKAVNGLTDSQRTKINDALRELEGIAKFFKPMKPAFDDGDAVKAWLTRTDRECDQRNGVKDGPSC
jgi:transcriptional regulator with XRE-family HTH domain